MVSDHPNTADHRAASATPERLESESALMTRSLETLLKAAPEATVSDVIAMLEQALSPPDSYRCLNPTCEESCVWPKRGEGRPKRFCSKRCRQMHDRVRDRLHSEVLELQAVLDQPTATKRQREELRSAVGKRQWALARYATNVTTYQGESHS